MQQLYPKQKVLVCFADPERTRWGSELVEGCGASPVVFGDDLRWKGLLACAFTSRAAAVIGDPQLVLGLVKLARSYGMPLKIRHAFLVGAEYGPWLHDGVRVGLDCTVTEVVLEEDRRDQDLRALEAHLLSWTSVLDCSLHKGDLGLEIHVRTFQGEKIPKIPSCARLVMRPWSPEGDIPMILTENH
jgi:hypothetical protein